VRTDPPQEIDVVSNYQRDTVAAADPDLPNRSYSLNAFEMQRWMAGVSQEKPDLLLDQRSYFTG
jgi:hypothetical protein